MVVFSLAGLLRSKSDEEKTAAKRAKIEAARRRAVVQARAQFEKLLKKEADYYQRRIVGTLGRIGFYYVSARKRTVQTVIITKTLSTPEAHYFRVDTGHLPHGTYVDDLEADKTLKNLCASCERHVSVVYDGNQPEKGFWFVVERAGAVRGIPAQVGYEDAYGAISNRAAPLVFTVGAGVNKAWTGTDLAKAPHILVAGSTGMGKSTFVNNVVCTIARRNNPDRVRFYMVDLKGGVELAQYEVLPHLARPIITDPAEVLNVLDDLLDEVERRMQLIKGKARNIDTYNRWKRREYVPHLVLVIDELAMLLLNKERYNKRMVKYWAENKLARLAAISRAAGIHIVAATQRPSVDVITGLIKANFPVRAALSCADNAQSRTILDNSMAANLNRPGRLIFHKGNKYEELQCPYVSEHLAEEIVDNLVNGESESVQAGVGVPRSVIYAQCMEYFHKDGKSYMPQERLWNLVKELGYSIPSDRFKELLRQMESERFFTIDGIQYEIHSAAGSAPRYFVRCQMSDEKIAEGVTPEQEDGTDTHIQEDDYAAQFQKSQDIDDHELRSGELPF